MNEIERQILKNQKTIMSFLNFGFKEQLTDGILSDSLSKRFDETNELLSPKQSNEPCCDMSEEEQEAYDLGVSRVREGASEVNCNFTIFSTLEKTKAWERGVEVAKQEVGRE